MNGRFHWSNYYKRAEAFGLHASLCVVILLSVLRPFHIQQHLFLIFFTCILFYSQKIRGYIPIYFIKHMRIKLAPSLRLNQKYKKFV